MDVEVYLKLIRENLFAFMRLVLIYQKKIGNGKNVISQYARRIVHGILLIPINLSKYLIFTNFTNVNFKALQILNINLIGHKQ